MRGIDECRQGSLQGKKLSNTFKYIQRPSNADTLNPKP